MSVDAIDRVVFSETLPTISEELGATVHEGTSNGLVVLDTGTRYLFRDETGLDVHQYDIPDSSDIQNCGGYLDKMLQYRDPRLLAYLIKKGVSKEALDSEEFPLLKTRSPQLDYLLMRFIIALREENPHRRVSLFDLGCTVAEHFDALDLMLKAQSKGKLNAVDVLSYCGVDMAPLVLCAAQQFHLDADPAHFKLTLGEGSGVNIPEGGFDLALSVGVINNLKDPILGLTKLLKSVKEGAVFAVWVADSEEGFWGVSHRSTPQYFYGHKDINSFITLNEDFKFLIADFIPEHDSTQQKHFIGVSEEQLKGVGCYHLIYTRRPELFSEFPELAGQ